MFFCITLWPYWRMPPIKLRYIGMKKNILFITFVICAVCAYSQTGLAKAPPNGYWAEHQWSKPAGCFAAACRRRIQKHARMGQIQGSEHRRAHDIWRRNDCSCVGGYLYLLFSNINGSDKAHPGWTEPKLWKQINSSPRQLSRSVHSWHSPDGRNRRNACRFSSTDSWTDIGHQI